MRSHLLKRASAEQEGSEKSLDQGVRFPPQSVGAFQRYDPHSELRMYTEEEVSAILRVSLSQLRKWRMKKHPGGNQGPRFKKVGRSVRYPESALIEFVNAP